MSAGNLMGSVLKSIKNIFSLEILINAKKTLIKICANALLNAQSFLAE